jgi:hypothetical protein
VRRAFLSLVKFCKHRDSDLYVLQTLLAFLVPLPGQSMAALATFMNEKHKTIKLITLNLLTNFITFPLYLKELPLHITHIKLTLKSHSEKWL